MEPPNFMRAVRTISSSFCSMVTIEAGEVMRCGRQILVICENSGSFLTNYEIGAEKPRK